MRRPSGNSSCDESIAAKWSDLRQYEEDQEAALREVHQVVGPDSGAREGGGGAKGRFHQLRKTSSKRFASIKSQISGMVNKGGSRGERRQGAPGEGGVSTTPGGEEGTQAGCGPLQSLGGRLRSSRSLQNLEQATKDSMRAMVDKTSYTASSMKHRYGSRVELSGKLTGKYDKFKDVDSDEENNQPY